MPASTNCASRDVVGHAAGHLDEILRALLPGDPAEEEHRRPSGGDGQVLDAVLLRRRVDPEVHHVDLLAGNVVLLHHFADAASRCC